MCADIAVKWLKHHFSARAVSVASEKLRYGSCVVLERFRTDSLFRSAPRIAVAPRELNKQVGHGSGVMTEPWPPEPTPNTLWIAAIRRWHAMTRYRAPRATPSDRGRSRRARERSRAGVRGLGRVVNRSRPRTRPSSARRIVACSASAEYDPVCSGPCAGSAGVPMNPTRACVVPMRRRSDAGA